ncbi:adenosine kinase [Desulfopila sp. IMCC35008]|uniref:adenosine kinase n=1 Tax=Desulfopila sp. IMCC35008 TaxID=2653858 RepID=UPI0013D252CA|nr:adenosine kinase [Desulfopila sp. IMCC35008]
MKESNTKKPVICVGSPVVDQVIQVQEGFLEKVGGEKGGMELVDSATLINITEKLPTQPDYTPGGSAGNTSFALARLGMPSRFLGTLGDDSAGNFFRDQLLKAGGDDTAIRVIPDLPTAQCLSLVTPDAERTMRTHLGAAMTFAPEHVGKEDFVGCGHAHIEGYVLFNPDLMLATLKAAKAAGCTISVDLASFEVVHASRTILNELLAEYVDIVFANEEEAEAFAGSSNPQTGLESLAELCETVAVKVGDKGALLCHAGECCHVPATIVEQVIDTTGAGDFWAAGFLYGLLSGKSMQESGTIGALLGGAVVACEGTTLPENQWQELRISAS